MKPFRFINPNDRRDAFLDQGISPGEDDSYDVQARKLMAQKDKLIDNTKRNVLERLELAIQNSRVKGNSEGPLSPVDFATQTLAKSIPSPNELNPANIIKAIPELAKGALEVAKHPLAALKQVALNGPPDPTTIASILLPGAALKAYRETVPLAARTYLHHMAGIPTPFSHVTEVEREILKREAQSKIDYLLEKQKEIDTVKAHALKNINDIKLMNKAELLDHFNEEGLNRFIIAKGKSTKQLRDLAIENYKLQRPSVFRTLEDKNIVKQDILGIGEEADNANVREEFKKITGKQLRGFQMYPNEFSTALGKTYVEPMVDKATGEIVPKAIKDTYKFYPDVYKYKKGEARNKLKEFWKQEPWEKEVGMNRLTRIIENLQLSLSPESVAPFGIVARKLGMRRPTSIIDIPLQSPATMNAYDKAAILLGAKPIVEKRK